MQRLCLAEAPGGRQHKLWALQSQDVLRVKLAARCSSVEQRASSRTADCMTPTWGNLLIKVIIIYYAHADRQGVDISFTVCFVCLFVRLRISPVRIKLAASNFARWFRGGLSKESPILGNFASQKLKVGRIGQLPLSRFSQGKAHAPQTK